MPVYFLCMNTFLYSINNNCLFQIVTSFLLQWQLHVLRKEVKGPVELVSYLSALQTGGRCVFSVFVYTCRAILVYV